MSENRFAECLTVRAVLRTFRNLQLIDADDQDDASARIRELTPPPTVSEEARERAEKAAGFQMLKLGLRPTGEWFECLVDSVIDALGYQPAEPKPVAVSEEARERARAEARKWWDEPVIVGRLDYSCADKLADRVIDALGYTTPAPPKESPQCPCPPGDCCVSQTASPPGVELAPDELRTLASVVETYEHLHTQLTNIAGIDHVPPYLDVFIDEGQSVRVVCDENGCWVLQIGGDQ